MMFVAHGISRVQAGITAAWCVLAWGVSVCGAAGPFSTHDFVVDVWQVEEGLPQISVTCITQTSDGYLWLGTFNGLVRFDGVRFRVFDEGNTPALGSSRITRLGVDAEGALWIVTEPGGLIWMQHGRFTSVSQGAGLPAAGVMTLARDGLGQLLLMDRRRGLHRVEHSRVSPLGRDQDPDPGELLHGVDGDAWNRQASKAGQPPMRVQALLSRGGTNVLVELMVGGAAPARGGGYWLASTNGLYHLESGRLQLRASLSDPDVPGIPHFIVEDTRGDVWLADPLRGLRRCDVSGSIQCFTAGSGLADQHISALFCDLEGSIWVGTGQGGLHRLKPRLIRMFNTRAGAAGNVVTSVSEDTQGRVWAGVNGGGVHRLDAGELSPVMEPAELRGYPLVYSVLADRDDALWAGIYGRSVLRLRNEELSVHTLPENALSRMIPRALFQDRAGNLWLGTEGGLHQYASGVLTRYTQEEGLSHPDVRALAEDSQGTLFIGTGGGGLNCLRDGRVSCHYTEREGLADNHVSTLYVDAEDTVWIGTVNGGLSRFKGGRFVNITVKDGLPSNTIGTILEDDRGYLWMGSNRGLIRVCRRDLDQFAVSQRGALFADVFTRSDGLSTVACMGSGQPGACKSRDGQLWFATVKGLAGLNPARLFTNAVPPPAIIEEVCLDEDVHDLQRADSQATPSGPLPLFTVSPHVQRVEFRFTGISLTAPEKVRFRYRLEGFDKDWIDAGPRRAAHYTRIPAGQYRFRVGACNNDGLWHEDGATLGLVVLPAWWETWWFRTLALGATLGAAFWAAESRVRRVRRKHAAQRSLSQRLIETQEAERKRMAAELHDSLGQNLLVIKNRALLGLQDPVASPDSAEQFDEISRMAATSLAEVREISHNLRPYQLDRLGLTKALKAMVTGVSIASGLRCVAEISSLDGLMPAPMEIHCYRVVQELLNNIVKHSHASEARVSAGVQDSRIRIIVEDDGCGFDWAAIQAGAQAQRGMGLGDIAERVRILEGKLGCDSQRAGGTRWTIEIPVVRDVSS